MFETDGRSNSATDLVPSGAIANNLSNIFIYPKATFKDTLNVLELRWYHPAPRPTVLLYTKSKTICLDIFFHAFLQSSLHGNHWLACSNGCVHDMLHEDCELHWARGMQRGILLLCSTWHWPTTLPDLRQITARKTGRLPSRLEKEVLLKPRKSFGFLGGVSCTFMGFQRHDPAFPHTTCHVKSKKKKKKKVQKNLGFFFDFMSPKYSHHSESSRQLLASHSWYVMFSRRSWLRFNEANRSLWQGAHALTRRVFWKC